MRNLFNRLFGRRDAPTRCQPGDLARIVSGPSRDRLVSVIDRGETPEGEQGAWWNCEALQSLDGAVCWYGPFCFPQGAVPAGARLVISDRMLQPFRPGEGADESLEWLPVPAPVAAPARAAEPAHA